jgi:hypothetical protein
MLHTLIPSDDSSITNPPVDMVMSHSGSLVFQFWAIAPAVASVALALYWWRKNGTALPLLVLLGGAACFVWEPVVDMLGGCWWPTKGGGNLFYMFDNRVIMWTFPLTYLWFMGGQALLAWKAFERRDSRLVVKMWLVCIVSDLLFEGTTLALGGYRYYGHQPLNTPWGFPLWWGPMNASIPITAGMLIYVARRHLVGRKMLLVPFLIPIADGLGNASSGFPAWIALHSDWPQPVANVCGLISAGLAALWIYLVILLSRINESKSNSAAVEKVAAAA